VDPARRSLGRDEHRVRSARVAGEFIDRIIEASRARAERDYDQLLKRRRQDDPQATIVNAWETSYYAEQVRQSAYDFDSQSVRPYFAYERVKQGVLDVTATLFGVRFRRVAAAPVWHESVECWQMYDGDHLVAGIEVIESAAGYDRRRLERLRR